MNLNGCDLCNTDILENAQNPDLSVELTGRKALPNYREGFLLIGFPDRSHSRLKIGLCSTCKESVDSQPPKFYKTILDNVRQKWVQQMQQMNWDIPRVVSYAKYMFSIEVYGYLRAEDLFYGKA